ncbi:hypothetical protein Vretimale_18935, partial [Volvox reticuliferus]
VNVRQGMVVYVFDFCVRLWHKTRSGASGATWVGASGLQVCAAEPLRLRWLAATAGTRFLEGFATVVGRGAGKDWLGHRGWSRWACRSVHRSRPSANISAPYAAAACHATMKFIFILLDSAGGSTTAD